jgi:hypothetical protein
MEFELRTESLEDLIREGLARESKIYEAPCFSATFFEDHLNLYEVIKEQMLALPTIDYEDSLSTRKRRFSVIKGRPSVLEANESTFTPKRLRMHLEDTVQE